MILISVTTFFRRRKYCDHSVVEGVCLYLLFFFVSQLTISKTAEAFVPGKQTTSTNYGIHLPSQKCQGKTVNCVTSAQLFRSQSAASPLLSSSSNKLRCSLKATTKSYIDASFEPSNDDNDEKKIVDGPDSKTTTRRLRRRRDWANRMRLGMAKEWIKQKLQIVRMKKRNLVTSAALTLALLFSSIGGVGQDKQQTLMASSTSSSQTSAGSHSVHRMVPSTMDTSFFRQSEVAPVSVARTVSENVALQTRGGGKPAQAAPAVVVEETALSTRRTIVDAMKDLQKYMEGPKADTLILLLATALITPVCKRFGTSPILGFLASGMLLGPNGCGLISGIHTTETLAELGIVFFLFEMGIELSVERLLSMKRDVFGLGLGQFATTALAIAGIGSLLGVPGNALVVLGGGLALSSSAFVLQLLKDKNQLATRFGKASFGVLLFQDLAVVPLLVVTPLLAGQGGSGGLAAALASASIKAVMALGSIAFAGRVLLNPLFKIVAQAQSQEAFLGVILLTVLSMSFMTEGLGLSNTLGAFLAGVLLSETKYRYQVEADIAPFRGMLLGLFFVTVGFEIDVRLILSQLPTVASLVVGIMAVKCAIVVALSRFAYKLSLSTSIQTGLMLSQGGEFAFVAFGLARSLGILSPAMTKLMLTSVSLTMALTPLMSSIGDKVAKKLEEEADFTHYLGQDRDASEIKDSDDFVIVVGFGVVGKVVCDLLDRRFIRYVGVEINPNKAIQARNKGLPVFYGDVGRQEVCDAFNVGKAKAVIVCIADKQQANRAVIALRRFYPQLKIFARAADTDHANRLQNTLDVVAMVPVLPEDNLLLTLPFGGAVMKALGVPAEEVNAILESKRKDVLQGRGLAESEEEAALVQLGVVPSTKPNLPNTPMTMMQNVTDPGATRAEAAAGRREQALQKSPFLAQVIEDVCPSSICEDDDDDDEAEKKFAVAVAVQTPEVLEEKVAENCEVSVEVVASIRSKELEKVDKALIVDATEVGQVVSEGKGDSSTDSLKNETSAFQ